MNNIVLSILGLALMSQVITETQLTKKERAFAVHHLSDSRNFLLKELNGLTEGQLNYKSSSSSWSIAECLDHLTRFENAIFDVLKESLALPANPDMRQNIRITDEQILEITADRSQKQTTLDEFVPNGQYGNYKATLTEFKTKRDKHIEYIKTTTDDLRNHFSNGGATDAYQLFLYMSGHTRRHALQIKEIKSLKDFPNN